MKHLKEVDEILKKHKNPKRAKDSAHIMNTRLELLGIPVPLQRKIAKAGYSFSDKSHKELVKIWDEVFNKAKSFEAMSQGLIFFEGRVKELKKEDWKVLKTWGKQIENWEHSDRLAKLIAELHEHYPEAVYPTLKLWNKAPEPWLRRLSVTGLFLYAILRETQPDFKKVIALVEPLIKDEDKYVQKGVGWTLRECYNVYPKQTLAFMKKHIKEMPAIVFSYSTEKLTKEEKEGLKKMRKKR